MLLLTWKMNNITSQYPYELVGASTCFDLDGLPRHPNYKLITTPYNLEQLESAKYLALIQSNGREKHKKYCQMGPYFFIYLCCFFYSCSLCYFNPICSNDIHMCALRTTHTLAMMRNYCLL